MEKNSNKLNLIKNLSNEFHCKILQDLSCGMAHIHEHYTVIITLGNSMGLTFYTDSNAYTRLVSDTDTYDYTYWDQQCKG